MSIVYDSMSICMIRIDSMFMIDSTCIILIDWIDDRSSV